MKLKELYPLYKEKHIENKKVILCHWKEQNGYEINNIDDFDYVMELFDDEVYLMNDSETKDFYFFEYFVMERTEPYVAIVRHPLMTNSYWKDLPDKINDMFVSKDSGIYRYLTVDYGKKIKEYVIEMPTTIDEDIYEFCKSRMPKGFRTASHSTSNVSLVFTNSSRFKDLDLQNFVTYKLPDIYKEWDIEKITTLSLSRKIWNDIKKINTSG